MSFCIHRTKLLSKRLSPAVQQVASYNDKFFAKKKQWPEHINSKRKTQVLRKILKDVEPTPHDTVLEEALRFSEAEFRAQLLHLREEWGKMYSAREEAARAECAQQHEDLEKERWEFVREIETRQANKRKIRNIPMSHTDKEPHSIEEDYRRSILSSPTVEVDSFLQQQANKTLVTPDNFDSILDQVLNENKADSAVEQRNGDNIAFVPIITHNIEFLLDQTPPKVEQISDS
ncbi:hypothetical protein ACHWQZ_G018534 [Mnemiopsis leidyi]